MDAATNVASGATCGRTCLTWMAACLLAKVSGSAVPIAMNVMALMVSFSSMKQPMCDATSPIKATTTPIDPMEKRTHR